MSNIHNEINQYCNVNNITDIEGFKDKLLKKAFTIEKYGYKPEMFLGRTNDTVVNDLIPVQAMLMPDPIITLVINEPVESIFEPEQITIIKEKHKNDLKTDIYDE